MAQSNHAGAQLLKYAHDPLVQRYLQDGIAGGADHFSTTAVLATNLYQIELTISQLRDVECIHELVVDPSYPFLVDHECTPFLKDSQDVSFNKKMDDRFDLFTRKEITCAWFLGDRNNREFKSVFENFKLF